MANQPTSPSRSPTGFHIVRVVLGVLLLTAAWLKAVALWNAEPSGAVLSSPRWQIATIEIEGLLGIWLLSGLNPRAAWLGAIILFASLAGFTLYLALDGQQSCKCFGAVKVNPYITFTIDVAAVVALLIWQPASGEMRVSGWFRGALQSALGAVGCFTLIGGAFLLASDDPVGALARLRGEVLTVEPAVPNIGSGVEGEQRELTLKLTNHSDLPIYVFGGTTAGYCNATIDLPTTIPPKESRSVRVYVLFRGAPGAFQHPFVFFTEYQKQMQVITASFTGRVIKKE